MALGQLGVLDLSVITDTLKGMLDQCIQHTPLWSSENIASPPTITVTGAQPEAVHNDGNCQLSLYLLHVSQDKFHRNAPVTGSRSSVVPQQPLALNLYYLLTAYAGKDYVLEQQAMSIALRCFYNQPIVKTVVQGNAYQEFTLSMEMESADERSRLWQALSVPFRLSVVYKVSVVFITPDLPATQPAPKPHYIGLAVNPTLFPYASAGQVSGTVRTVFPPSPMPPAPGTPNLNIHKYDLSPATVAAGETFLLQGAGFNQTTSRRVYLLLPNGTEYEVTNWIVPVSLPPGISQSETQFILKLPTATGLPPDTPPPGIYQLRVGSDTAQGDAQTFRSNATPFSIAAFVQGPSSTSNGQVNTSPAILTPPGGPFTIHGRGFTTGKTELFLDTIQLSSSEFTINPNETTITFNQPGNLAPGRYTVRVRVNQVESAPAWWIDIL